eukprot:CAMPEP_0171297466 /NCGR_PEP_ID=MMETSP0816-20121228/6200_1 /TAXON_ID=420281 /ORGANISM="Proboscia inermis, Strain CCAP1064/1" /LENGTH=383 /DNA_ID=CAMNT_0011771747 /DNA_START=147 /DNA_END=1295 /DNA_ORIENTATION=-
MPAVMANEAEQANEAGSNGGADASASKNKINDAKNPLLDENADWGTFYDPKDIFCGKFDCYKILGFDYLTFETARPSLKEITKNYRSLSRAWHPDKNKKTGAKERFVKISRAYEVLTDVEQRKEYDHYRDRPDAYFQKYGSGVTWSYAPKSNTTAVVLALLISLSAFTIWLQHRRWRTIADHVIKAAVEGLGIKDGGSHESLAVRQKALKVLEKRQADEKERNGTVSPDVANISSTKKGGKTKKENKKEKAKQEAEAEKESLRPIVTEFVEQITDFGGGFRKPTWKDTFVVQLAVLPYYIIIGLFWWLKYVSRRLRKLDYNDEELNHLTKNAIGRVAWDASDEEERNEMITRELWISDNLEEWKEMQETKQQSVGYQKKYARW